MNIPSIHPELEHHSELLKSSSCLNRLEHLAIWFAKRQNRDIPEHLNTATVLFAADHGVHPRDDEQPGATLQRLKHIAHGNSAIADLCKQAGNRLHVIDLGVDPGPNGDRADPDSIEHAIVRRGGSADITREAAMSQQEYWEAVGIGEEMATRCITDGANLLIAGAISETSAISNAAVAAELLGLTPEEALQSARFCDPNRYADALMAVEHAKARATGTPSHDILRELGGFETAAMAGFYRAAIENSVPILLDGYASATAALAALAWDVRMAGWMMASHVSADGGHRAALEELGLEPLVELQCNLDEGKLATLMVPLLQAAITLQQGLMRIEANSKTA